MAEPDPYSGAWFAKQFKGINHLLNRIAAEYDDQFKAFVELRNDVTVLTSQHVQDVEKIGELQQRIVQLEQWRVRFAPWAIERLPKDPLPKEELNAGSQQ